MISSVQRFKDVQVVVLGWPAGLNTSYIYGGLVLLQNLNDIQLVICLKQLFMGSQLICSNSFCPICAVLLYYSNLDRGICIYFGVSAILTLIFFLSKGAKLNKHNQNGAVLESYKVIYEEAETRICFFCIEIWVQRNNEVK